MWSTETPWFVVALVMSVFALGSVVFGRFEQHKPRGRRVLKQVVVVGVVVIIDRTAGRNWALGLLALPAIAAAVVHLWWLPKHGINGWTAEPYEAYLTLMGAPSGRDTPPPP